MTPWRSSAIICPPGRSAAGKYSNFEAGTRVPFLVRWPARVKPAVSAALVSQVDLLASFAALLGSPASDPARQGQRERARGRRRHRRSSDRTLRPQGREYSARQRRAHSSQLTISRR